MNYLSSISNKQSIILLNHRSVILEKVSSNNGMKHIKFELKRIPIIVDQMYRLAPWYK